MTPFQPDDFRGDWYGYLTNNISHLSVGILWAWLASLVYFYVVGEYPYKLQVLIGLGLGYMAYEVIRQGWQGVDTVEDWIFFTLWGVGGSMAAFNEITPGSIWLALNPEAPLPFFLGASLHLAIGVAIRVRRKRYNERR